jgi:GRIP domain
VLLDDAQEESQLRSEQAKLLKAEVRDLDAKLAAADKLQDGTPFSYLRTIVVRYLETGDPTLLPVLANLLSFTEEEMARIRGVRNGGRLPRPSGSTGKPESASYFGTIPFLRQ